ncbi:hypothetical protein AGMMS49983_20830 [Clostridia bacterium]|nr:hypothetical protein AGMMS49983_20830 [Clostridia bacterium]
MYKRALLCLTIVFFFAASLLGCSVSGDQNTFEKDKKRIVFVSPQLDFPVWNQAKAGFEKAMEEYGFYGEWVGADNCNMEDMKREISIAVSENVDAVITCPLTPSEFTETFEEVRSKGIPVITLLVDAESPELRTAFIAPNYKELGLEQTRALHDKVGDEMKIGVIMSGLTTENQMIQVACLKDYIKDYPKSEIIAYAEDYNNPINGMNILLEMLAEHPEMNSLFVTSGDAVPSYGKIVLENDLLGKLTVIGMDITEVNLSAVQNGGVYGVMGQDVYNAGYLGGKYAFQSALGENVPSLTYVDHELITKENIDDSKIIRP